MKEFIEIIKADLSQISSNAKAWLIDKHYVRMVELHADTMDLSFNGNFAVYEKMREEGEIEFDKSTERLEKLADAENCMERMLRDNDAAQTIMQRYRLLIELSALVDDDRKAA